MGPNYNFMGPNFGPRGNNFAPISNKIVVKSLEDALRRYADFDSDMVYLDANQNVLYNIYTDVRGEKSYEIFDIVKREKPVQQGNVTNDVLQAINKQLQDLGAKVEDLYGKYNAQQTGSNP